MTVLFKKGWVTVVLICSMVSCSNLPAPVVSVTSGSDIEVNASIIDKAMKAFKAVVPTGTQMDMNSFDKVMQSIGAASTDGTADEGSLQRVGV